MDGGERASDTGFALSDDEPDRRGAQDFERGANAFDSDRRFARRVARTHWAWRVLFLTGRIRAGEAVSRSGAKPFERRKVAIGCGACSTIDGTDRSGIGSFEEAKQHIAQSLSIFTTIGSPYEVAKSHYEMALLMQGAARSRTPSQPSACQDDI